MPPDQLRNVYVKCLGFDSTEPQYLNAPSEATKVTSSGEVQIGSSKLELAVNPDPSVSKGTEWYIYGPWPEGTISIARQADFVDADGTVMPGADVKFLEGKADGSVEFNHWGTGQDKDRMRWVVYPYLEDTGD